MSYSTNDEIIQAVSNLMAPETQTVFQTAMKDGTDLSKYAAIPMTVMNEFISTMVNKVFEQRVYDPLKFVNPFDVFETSSPTFGAIIELDATVVPQTEDYSEASTLTEVKKPEVKVNYIYTRDKIKVHVTYSEEQIRGAFVKEGGLAELLSQFTKKLFDARNLFLYDAIKTDLKSISIEHQLSSAGTTDATAKGVYQEIVNLIYDMKLPSDEYNENGLKATLNRPILVLNTATSASFDVNVAMSLFNYFQSDVTTEKLFDNIIRIKDSDDNKLVGYVLDGEKYLWSNRILEIRSFYDGSNLMSHYWLHNWIIRGLNPNVDGVKLIIPAESV